ncbi:hypothetical protein MERGE_001951 [Pneumocystis wakefieldiae]|uniref:Uncharacterized protein n=1 Tax=Pneumocystis wakefieldiae TaxID=38082 RepID=A0A899FZE8_9ASCO|nr:hypothetical protein MERGE_001951 [Pneumocystis wakefieldiae]
MRKYRKRAFLFEIFQQITGPLEIIRKLEEDKRDKLDCVSQENLGKKCIIWKFRKKSKFKDEMVNDETKGWFKGPYGRAISIMRFGDAITELRYFFDDSSGQWFNGMFDQMGSRNNDIKISEVLLEKSFNDELKQERRRNLFILKEMFHDPLVEEKSNKGNKSNLSNSKERIFYNPQNFSKLFNNDYINAEVSLANESIIKNDALNDSKKTSALETKKSIINLKELKSIFSSEKEEDLQNIQESDFCFFDDNSGSDDKIDDENDRETNVNANNIPIVNKRCFFNNCYREFPLFFPHFDNAELYALSAFSKVPNIFSQEIDNEEVEKKWIDSRKEFTRDWKRKWKDAQKRKRKSLHRKSS